MPKLTINDQTIQAADGMVVYTETSSVVEARQLVLEMLLSNYRETPGEEVQGRFVWGVDYRGGQTKIVAGLDTNMLDARCESCGACAAFCPTGALTDRMSFGRRQPEKRGTTTCGYCGVDPRPIDITGVSIADLRQAAKILASHHPMAVIWAMGITQHTTGVMNVLSLANLQMLLGNMGTPGGGVNPLRGQNNVQGACDMGALPNVFPGYQPVLNEQVRAKFDAAWRTTPDQTLQTSAGLTVTEMVKAAGAGDIRALYILGEDPVLTEPDSNHVRQALQSAPFVLLQEIFPSETSPYADMLFPAASFAEKSGTFTNTERRIQLLRHAIDPPGEALADWEITARLARQILEIENRRPTGSQACWNYCSAAEIMDETYPLLLTTGRVLYHWHGGELTRRAEGLSQVYPEAVAEISPDDAARLSIKNETPVRVASRRGEMIARAVLTDRVSPGVVFGNFHFPGPHNINNVTLCELDAVAKIPEYKVCAVAVTAM